MIIDVLIIAGVIWLAGAIITGLAITYNWRGLRTLVLNEVPEVPVGPLVLVACLAWFLFATIWISAWIKEFINHWFSR